MIHNERDERLITKIKRELGKPALDALADDNVIEIMLNSDGSLWKESFGKPMEHIGSLSAANAKALLGTIASYLDTTITINNPIIECELPIDGSRFEGIIPPIVTHPTFTIRKKASKVFTLDDYLKQNIITSSQLESIKKAIYNPDCAQTKKNILIVGGTGSGKTTLTNAVIDGMVKATPNDRIIVIEDTKEIQCTAKNNVILKSSDHVDMLRLLKATMRLRPDRILVGEVRGKEALDLLKAWNTGHNGGVATIHANSAAAGLTRMEQLIAEASSADMKALIAEAIDVVIFIAKTPKGREVKEIIEVAGYDNIKKQYKTKRI